MILLQDGAASLLEIFRPERDLPQDLRGVETCKKKRKESLLILAVHFSLSCSSFFPELPALNCRF